MRDINKAREGLFRSLGDTEADKQARAKTREEKKQQKLPTTAREMQQQRLAEWKQNLIKHTDPETGKIIPASQLAPAEAAREQTPPQTPSEKEALAETTPATETSSPKTTEAMPKAEEELTAEKPPEALETTVEAPELKVDQVIEATRETINQVRAEIQQEIDKAGEKNPETSQINKTAEVGTNLAEKAIDIEKTAFNEATNKEKLQIITQAIEERTQQKESLEHQATNIEAQLNSIEEAKAAVINSDLTAAEKGEQISRLQLDQTRLEAEKSKLETQIATLTSEIESLTQERQKLETQIQEAERLQAEKLKKILELGKVLQENQQTMEQINQLIEKAENDIAGYQKNLQEAQLDSVKETYQKLIGHTQKKQKNWQQMTQTLTNNLNNIKTVLQEDLSEIAEFGQEGDLEAIKIKEPAIKDQETMLKLAELLAQDMLKEAGKDFGELRQQAENNALTPEDETLWQKIWRTIFKLITGENLPKKVKEKQDQLLAARSPQGVSGQSPDPESDEILGQAMWETIKDMPAKTPPDESAQEEQKTPPPAEKEDPAEQKDQTHEKKYKRFLEHQSGARLVAETAQFIRNHQQESTSREETFKILEANMEKLATDKTPENVQELIKNLKEQPINLDQEIQQLGMDKSDRENYRILRFAQLSLARHASLEAVGKIIERDLKDLYGIEPETAANPEESELPQAA